MTVHYLTSSHTFDTVILKLSHSNRDVVVSQFVFNLHYTDYQWCFFLSLLAICLFFFGKYLFNYFAQVFTSPSSVMYFMNIFSVWGFIIHFLFLHLIFFLLLTVLQLSPCSPTFPYLLSGPASPPGFHQTIMCVYWLCIYVYNFLVNLFPSFSLSPTATFEVCQSFPYLHTSGPILFVNLLSSLDFTYK